MPAHPRVGVGVEQGHRAALALAPSTRLARPGGAFYYSPHPLGGPSSSRTVTHDLPSLRSRTTTLLRTAESDPPALDELVDPVYVELKRMARRQLAREAPGHTLQPTALVHEAYLRMVDASRVDERGRAYFYAAAAQAMRRVLVDHARRRGARKRGGDRVMESLKPETLAVDAFAGDLLDLHDALERLAERSPRQARVVECRYFGGMSVQETARALDVSPRTVKYDWSMARAWLFRALGGEAAPSG